MHLVTFEVDGEAHIGGLTQRGLVDFATAAPALPQSMIQLLQAGPRALRTAAAVTSRALEDGVGLVDAAAARLLAPLPRPGKILGIGLNYRDHAAETGRPEPEVPFVFSKAVTAVIGPGDAIVVPPVSREVDFEGELAVVIGRTARRLAAANALEVVAGYTCMLDVSARDYQRRSGHCLAKSFDTFAPMGPAIVTADEIRNPAALELRTHVSGEMMQHSNTRELIFDVPTLIEFLSACLTLEPGDVITTGTPSGVGAARKPPRFLRPGDSVRVEIEGIGVLENEVRGVGSVRSSRQQAVGSGQQAS
jgi:2-keto-4-pentenoate hydratase/2-oxohepta-3-ene-1,7-dioic acid hydratase in catechol pathway